MMSLRLLAPRGALPSEPQPVLSAMLSRIALVSQIGLVGGMVGCIAFGLFT